MPEDHIILSTRPISSPLRDCVAMMKTAKCVILNKVKNLMHSIRYTTQILRLTPQNDITTQSLTGEDQGEGAKLY